MGKAIVQGCNQTGLHTGGLIWYVILRQYRSQMLLSTPCFAQRSLSMCRHPRRLYENSLVSFGRVER